MLKFRCCLIALVVTCLGGSLVSAEPPVVDPKRLMWGEDHDQSRFKSKPARDLMSKSEYKTYRRALETLDCKAAGKVLNLAFIREYPQFKRARLVSHCLKDRGCRYWTIYANSTFLEYGFCRAVLNLKIAERDLQQGNMVLPKFALKPWPQKTEYGNHFIWRRDEALALLVSQAELNYVPALVKLATLVKRGDIFNASDEIEYYILRRACTVGSDCAALAHRIAELRRRIAPDRVSVIEAKTQATPSKRPRLQLLLLGEKL